MFKSRRFSTTGFTLLELLVVMSLMFILSITAYMLWPKDDFSVMAQADTLAADIRYVQALSIANNEKYRIDLTNSSQYQILDSAGNVVSIPSVNATVVTLQTGVTYSSPVNYLVFDSHGTPYSSSTKAGAGTALSGDLAIIVSERTTSMQINVVSETGAVYIS